MDFSPIIAIYLSAGLAAGALAVWWAVAVPRIALFALFGSVAMGQIGRLALPGQGGGLLISDIAVVLVLVAAGAYTWRSRRPVSIVVQHLCILISLFLLWSAFPLALHGPELGVVKLAIAGAYLVRLGSHLLLLPALFMLFQDARMRNMSSALLLWAASFVAVGGLLQLAFAPSIANIHFLLESGWDPHVNRLVSTWLDPNFVGAFFAMMLIYALCVLFTNSASTKKRTIMVGVAVLFSLALVLTRSRSSLIALGVVVSMSVVALLHKVAFTRERAIVGARFIVLVSGLLALGTLGALLLGERLPALVLEDPTVSLRAESLQAAWRVFGPTTILVGEGYNAYQFAAVREGIGDSFSTHSRAGLDNSFLTLWVTVGVVGIILFALPWVYAVSIGWKNAWRNKKLIGIAPLALLVLLGTHAQFVNSLLYGHLLITLAVLTVVSIQESE